MFIDAELELLGSIEIEGLSAQTSKTLLQQYMKSQTIEGLEVFAGKLQRHQSTFNSDDVFWFSLQELKKLMHNEANRRKIAKLGLSYSNGEPAQMSGAELASMLKSNVRFKSTDGIKCEELKLSEEEMTWWRDAKLGMFIHWGAYSSIGRGEWVMHQEQISEDDYREIAMSFNPQSFDANAWAALAKEAGMHYMVMTARHHDGFSLWDSAGSYKQFTTMQADAHRDFVKEYTEAARANGLKVGLYYSPMDFRFPGYYEPVEQYDNALLMKKQAYDQVEELMSQYGTIDILWYDGSWLAFKGSDAGGAWLWEPLKLNKMVRSHNPQAVINERSGWEGDFSCDEGPHDIGGSIIPFPWEKNFSIAGSWAWRPENRAMSFEQVMHLILNVFVRDGNALLNVTPDKDGLIPEDQIQLFRQIGHWMRQNGESIYGTRGGPWQPVDGIYGATYRDNVIYLHIFNTGDFRFEKLPPIEGAIIACSTLEGKQIPYQQGEDGIQLSVPESVWRPLDTIVRITLDRNITTIDSSQ